MTTELAIAQAIASNGMFALALFFTVCAIDARIVEYLSDNKGVAPETLKLLIVSIISWTLFRIII